ncbi:hypothetical protein ACS0TY_007381 [Phlomoides rotata]
MVDLHFSILLVFFIIFPLVFFLFKNSKSPTNTPTSYPILGSIFTIWKNKERRIQWISDILTSTPNLTFTLRRPFGYHQIFTADAANVEHMLKSHFHNYPKGHVFRNTLSDFLGDGIFNADGSNWMFQRQVSSHQFNTRSLRKFVETVVDAELSDRLIPMLENAAGNDVVVDLQDALQRFAFDNLCRIAFGYDPSEENFAHVFDRALRLISERFNSNIPMVWKLKRALCFGKEKELNIRAGEVRRFAKNIIREKKRIGSCESEDLLSRFLNTGHSDEDFVTDVVISFIVAGRDTTSAALTWFFWLIFNHEEAETEILREITESSEEHVYDEVKNMVYTHASLCETMRLYPPVPVSTKSAANDDVLPDGTVVRKGTRISYHPYAMGRVEKVWGGDWADFRPGRWLEWEETAKKWSFVGRDPYTYPVFQAGPRSCLGKDMSFLQMKRVATAVLRRFKVVPVDKSMEPVYVSDFTAKMKGGFPVKIVERVT